MRTYYVFLLCLSTWSSFAQDYHPLIQRGVYRDEFWAAELHLCPYDYGTRYWFRGDTMAGGQLYQRLLYAGIRGEPTAPLFCPPYTVDTTIGMVYALMREEVATKQVFQFDPTTNTEFLLFDFSVQVGDSVTVGHPSQTVYIASEGYENWSDGSSRRRLVVHAPAGTTDWLESVGASGSLWDPLAAICICPHTICYQQNGQSYGGECATVVRTKEPAKDQAGLSLAPNPANEVIRVNTLPNQDFDHIAVFDFAGRIVMEQHYTMGIFSAELPVSCWPTGNYVAVIWHGGQWLGQQIFQKN